MRSIQTTMQVLPDGTVRLGDSASLPPGDHQVVLTVLDNEEQARQDQALRDFLAQPPLELGPWPADLSLRREDMYGDWGR
jgi:hypothetical protein